MSIAVRPDAPAVDPVRFAEGALPAVGSGAPVHVRVGDAECEVTGDLAMAVVAVIGLAGAGQPVDINALPMELTTGQAADILHVSRPTVVALIEKGLLPATRVGTHRRIRAADVFAYRDQSRSVRKEALDEVSRISSELGLYES